MPTTLNIVQGDSGYPLNFTLQTNAGVAIDISSITSLILKVQQYNAEVVKFSGAMNVDSGPAGTCHYTVQPTDFDQEGRYKAEITITFTTGEVLSFVNIIIVAAPKLPAA